MSAPRIVREDGYRLCPFCWKEWIGQAMGFTLVGDVLLAWTGRMPWSHVRERCFRCAARYELDREGLNGPRRLALARIHDLCRLVWFRWRMGRAPTL